MKISLRSPRALILLALFCCTTLFPSPIAAQDTTAMLYIPLLVSDVDDCALGEQEQALVDLLVQAPEQGRPSFSCNAFLQQAARAQSQDMAERAYCATVDPDGNGPNYRVRAAGYTLPGYYSTAPNANNVQTIACGYTTAQAVWDALLPNDHLEGKGSFWSKQVEYGIAHYTAEGSPFIHYWVIITAEPV